MITVHQRPLTDAELASLNPGRFTADYGFLGTVAYYGGWFFLIPMMCGGLLMTAGQALGLPKNPAAAAGVGIGLALAAVNHGRNRQAWRETVLAPYAELKSMQGGAVAERVEVTASRGWPAFGHDGNPARLLDAGGGIIVCVCTDELDEFEGAYPSRVEAEHVPHMNITLKLELKAPAPLPAGADDEAFDLNEILGQEPSFARVSLESLSPDIRKRLGI